VSKNPSFQPKKQGIDSGQAIHYNRPPFHLKVPKIYYIFKDRKLRTHGIRGAENIFKFL
jgi:hypothetical protein